MLKSVKKLCHIFDQPDHVPHVTGLGPHGHPAASVLKRVAQVPHLLLLATTSPSPHPFSTATISWAGLQGVSSCPLSRAGRGSPSGEKEGACLRGSRPRLRQLSKAPAGGRATSCLGSNKGSATEKRAKCLCKGGGHSLCFSISFINLNFLSLLLTLPILFFWTFT